MFHEDLGTPDCTARYHGKDWEGFAFLVEPHFKPTPTGCPSWLGPLPAVWSSASCLPSLGHRSSYVKEFWGPVPGAWPTLVSKLHTERPYSGEETDDWEVQGFCPRILGYRYVGSGGPPYVNSDRSDSKFNSSCLPPPCVPLSHKDWMIRFGRQAPLVSLALE